MNAPDIQWSLERRKLKDLVPHGKNPRKLSKHDYEHIKLSLEMFGCIDKPVINTDNTIIGGHQRIAVLKKMGVKEIECWVPDKALMPQQADELNIRLNRNQGEWDFDILANQWDENDLVAWGFDAMELNLDLVEKEDEDPDSEIQIKCPTCGKKMKK
jgi:ParB-like chromosome segregation protein Spo0J